MAIDQSRSKPAALQVSFLVSLVALMWGTDAYDASISDSDGGRIAFAATHIDELCIP
jgi:hypothetical protein